MLGGDSNRLDIAYLRERLVPLKLSGSTRSRKIASTWSHFEATMDPDVD